MMMVGFWGVLIDYRNDAVDEDFIGQDVPKYDSSSTTSFAFILNLTPQLILSITSKGR